jgi:hypothetical protein
MLETPTRGRFYKEERFLVFEPEPMYLTLVYACIGCGGVSFFFGLVERDMWFLLVGLAVLLSGLWANLSLVRIRFDLKSMTYRRRQGPGLVPRLWHGTVDELDALVVVAEPSLIAPGSFRYHLVLHWKEHRAPLMVLESELRASPGGPQMGGQYLVAKATRYASSMKIPVYDNSHYLSPCPVTVWS